MVSCNEGAFKTLPLYMGANIILKGTNISKSVGLYKNSLAGIPSPRRGKMSFRGQDERPQEAPSEGESIIHE